MTDLLRVEDLWVRFPKRGGGMIEAVRGISFSVGRERVGIVGESGSGKSMTGRAILRLVRPPGEATAARSNSTGSNCRPSPNAKCAMSGAKRFLWSCRIRNSR